MSTLDKFFYSDYDSGMKTIGIVGGGAAGMTAAILLARKGFSVHIFERGERLGRKLSVSGNGQGNLSNEKMDKTHYFSDDVEKVGRLLARFSKDDLISFLEGMGGMFLPDRRGRIYPVSRQASSVTDLLRRELDALEVKVHFQSKIEKIEKKERFSLLFSSGEFEADEILLSCGGKAAPNFGTDGSSYALAQRFGHSITPLKPVLVQLKCDPKSVRGLKGIRTEAALSVERKGKLLFQNRGDVLFTESGISGDAVFFASSYTEEGDSIFLDLVPDVEEEILKRIVSKSGLLCLVKGGIAKMLSQRAQGEELIKLLKRFPLEVKGTLGFSQAQVTRGGIPLRETNETLESVFQKGLFFAGEMLNVDGECGGYNLQWAFTSAYAAFEGILKAESR